MYLTKRQLADRWQVSIRTIDRYRAAGCFKKAERKLGNSVRFSLAEIEKTEKAKAR